MTIQKINSDDIETFTLTTNPPRTFSSSSSGTVSGTLYVFPRRSSFEKEVHPLSNFSGSYFDQDLDVIRNSIVLNTGSNKESLISSYLQSVNSQSISLRKQQTVEILRFVPSADFSSDSLRKSVVLNNLMPFYRGTYPEAHFAFTNYNSLNFLTASGLPEDSAIIYADKARGYALTGAFSFDFWINPRYTTDFEGANYNAGTLFHRSSSYALSLLTGSSKDINGLPDAFKLVLQLSHSAEINPSLALSGVFPNNLIFSSDDNALVRNTWNHVTVRWPGSSYNNGSGSFVINGITKGTFVLASSSLPETHNENCLFVGNFFQGTFVDEFFTTEVSERDGLTELVAGSGQAPSGYVLNNPLNAEVHELKIYNRYLNDDEIEFLNTRSPSTGSALLHDNLLFYVPPFFTKESPYRKFYGDHGGIITTPFYEKDGTTTTPINVDASFGAFGHYVNLENFVRDFATSQYGRLFHLTASVISGTATTPQSFNDYLYASGSNLKRNLTVIPNDNGILFPNFTFMIPGRDDYVISDKNNVITYYSASSTTGSFASPWKVNSEPFVNDLGNPSPGFVTLRSLLPPSAFQTPAQEASGSLQKALDGAGPDNLGDLPSSHGRYTVLQRTGDRDCNQVVFFDISNLYYGLQIEPGTLTLKDTNFSGSMGKMEMTLKDDGEGNIFRSNHSGSVPDWASAGNIFYNEGIILLKHPSLYFFGNNQYEISFKGKQNTHILTFNLFKRPLTVFSSSNPNYLPVSASTNANDTDNRFVYLTTVNVMDDNLNIIEKSAFSQTILARTSDRFLFKIKLDF